MAELEDDDSPLARYVLDYEPGDQLSPAAALEGLHLAIRARAGAAKRSQQTLGLPTAEEVTIDDAAVGLGVVPQAREELDATEIALIEIALDRGATWEGLARRGAASSGEALRRRYRRLGGTRSWPAGRPRKSGGA